MQDKIFVSRETKEKLKEYERLLLQWNSKINLISKQDENKIWERHFIDSLQLFNYLNKDIHLVDIGSGGGFPGMILSIAGVNKVTLIESDYKKTVFLLQIAKLSSNEVNIINDRVENVRLVADVMTARAFTNIDNLLSLTNHIVIKDKILLLKGNSYNDELLAALKNWRFDYNLYNSITDKKSKIIEIIK